MDFQSASFGVDFMGMENYIQDLNTIVLSECARALDNTAEIEAAIRKGWQGEAPEIFIKNLRKAKNNMITTLSELQKAFDTELRGIKSAIIDMDANMISED